MIAGCRWVRGLWRLGCLSERSALKTNNADFFDFSNRKGDFDE